MPECCYCKQRTTRLTLFYPTPSRMFRVFQPDFLCVKSSLTIRAQARVHGVGYRPTGRVRVVEHPSLASRGSVGTGRPVNRDPDAAVPAEAQRTPDSMRWRFVVYTCTRHMNPPHKRGFVSDILHAYSTRVDRQAAMNRCLMLTYEQQCLSFIQSIDSRRKLRAARREGGGWRLRELLELQTLRMSLAHSLGGDPLLHWFDFLKIIDDSNGLWRGLRLVQLSRV